MRLRIVKELMVSGKKNYYIEKRVFIFFWRRLRWTIMGKRDEYAVYSSHHDAFSALKDYREKMEDNIKENTNVVFDTKNVTNETLQMKNTKR